MTEQSTSHAAPQEYLTGDLVDYADSIILTRETRVEDWDALGFQTKAGPQFARAQIRYVGAGATGATSNTNRIIPSQGFTFSNMLLPPGAEGPEHVHHDSEEAFFVLEGEAEFTIHRGQETATRKLGYRDLIVIPPGVPRSVKNTGDKNALFCVIIGTQKPQVPEYPETSAMHGVTRG